MELAEAAKAAWLSSKEWLAIEIWLVIFCDLDIEKERGISMGKWLIGIGLAFMTALALIDKAVLMVGLAGLNFR